jgi:hypothetical protein
MKFLRLAVLLGAALFGIGEAGAAGGSASGTLTITIQAPLAVAFAPTAPSVPCNAPAGTIVAAVSTSGGNGNAPTLAMTGDTADFALAGSNIVVGPAGIAAASCGTTRMTTVTATQP